MKTMEHLTMQELEDLGFEIVKSYEHDAYRTQRRQKGCIQVETTWLNSGEFVSQDLWIKDGMVDGFPKQDLLLLDRILNKKQ